MAAEAVALPVVEIIVQKLVDLLVAPIGRQFGYLFCYDENIANITKKVEDLLDKRDVLQQQVDAAERNSQTIASDVMRWLDRVDDKKADAEQIVKDSNDKVGKGCLNRWCVNLKPRYSLSKRAVKKARELDQLLEQYKFEEVANPKLPLGVVPDDGNPISDQVLATASSTSTGFMSRNAITEDIVESLKDYSVRVVRICGMGGVGKTTMANDVEKRVRDEHLFQEISKAEFTTQPDVRRIQLLLAESVGLKFDQEHDQSAWAVRIWERLNDKKKKILLILDNVWRREDLENVGICLDEEKMNCKILLTSRSEDVCADLKTQKIFKVGVLSDQEALMLFQDSVGGVAASNARMHKLAASIVEKCGGLPLAVTTIGRALANKTEVTWKNVLGQLQKSTLQGEYAAVLNSLQVSYDVLEPEEMKDLFLLCSLFPEGFDVPIEDLVRYGKALRLFQNTDNMEEARTRAHSHVEKLVNSNLLLVSPREEHVKMHDLVRGFALSTASKGLYMVSHGHGARPLTEWPVEDENKCQHYTSISLQCGDIDELPDELDYPKLKLLKLVSDNFGNRLPKLPEDFYKGMGTALNVVAFSGMFVPLAPNSVQLSANLRTLFVNGISRSCDISTIVNLENLEVLSLADSVVKLFPKETGKFGRKLRLLDLTNTKIKDGFPSDVLSRFIRLEELYVRDSRGFYSAEEEQKERFDEIKTLSKLVVLDINTIHDVQLFNFPFENLERFKISNQVKENWVTKVMLKFSNRGYKPNLRSDHYRYRFQNTLKLIVDKSVLVQDGYKALLSKTEILDLRVEGLETFLEESQKEDFLNLNTLSLDTCNELVYIIKTRQLDQKNIFPCLQSLYLYNLSALESIYRVENSKEIFNGIEEVDLQVPMHSLVGLTTASFGNLRILDVRDCNKLEYIFSLHIARGLVMLERLLIVDCRNVQAIFSNEDEKLSAMGRIDFPRLNYFELHNLPKLTSLFANGNNLTSAGDPFFNQKGVHTAVGFRHLRTIVVSECSSLRQLFAPSSAILFEKLQNLELKRCEDLEAIVATEFEEDECGVKGILFPQLNSLNLKKLQNLSTLMPNNCTFNWLSLRKLVLDNCGRKSDLFAYISGLQKDTPGETLTLTNVEEMKIRKMNSSMLWSNLFPARCSFKLKKLDLSYHDGPTISHLIKRFDILEELSLEFCSSFEVAIDLEDLSVVEQPVFVLPRLLKLQIGSLECMKHVWKIGPRGFVGGFQNLTELNLIHCIRLRYPLSPFIAKYLVKLQSIDIEDCMMMEQVVSNRDDEERDINAGIIFLPELDKMSLKDLKSLVRIGPAGVFDYNQPSLEDSGIGSSKSTNHHEVIANISNEKYPKSSSAASGRVEGIAQRQLPAWSLCYPRILHVLRCDRLLHVISSNTVAGLQKIKNLRVDDCGSVVEIFGIDVMNNTDEVRALTIPNLRILLLESLPKLMHICRSKLCRGMNFPNLKSVIISKCDTLRYLFSYATVTSLVHLQVIKVVQCNVMEVIVKEFEDEVDEASATTKLVLPRLEAITLSNLPKLGGICLGLRDFEFTSLAEVEIIKCPEMNLFTTGYSSTPKLESVKINSALYPLELVKDLNTFLKHVQDEIKVSEDGDESDQACSSSSSD